MAAQLDRLQAHYHGSCTFGIPSKNRTKRNETGQQKEKLGKGKGATNIWSRSAFVGAKHTHTQRYHGEIKSIKTNGHSHFAGRAKTRWPFAL